MNPTAPPRFGVVRAGLLALLLPAFVCAQSSDTTSLPWLDGARHPLAGRDHLAVLVALGLAAAQLGGRTRWGLPLMFALLMAFGIVLGGQGAVVPMLDTIVLTVALCLGLLILSRVRLVFGTVATALGAFALFHGLADGIEIVTGKFPAEYLLGFSATNIVLIAIGLGLGEWFRRHGGRWSAPLRRPVVRMHG